MVSGGNTLFFVSQCMMVAKAESSPSNGTLARHSIVILADDVNEYVVRTAAEKNLPRY